MSILLISVSIIYLDLLSIYPMLFRTEKISSFYSICSWEAIYDGIFAAVENLMSPRQVINYNI